jgi:hypothetical protein
MRLNKAFFEKNKEYFNFYGVIILIASIMVFGPMFSKWYGANFINKVNENGKIIEGKIIGIGNSKGDYYKVRYYYKYTVYTHQEGIKNTDLRVGQNVVVMVDSTDPFDAYVIDNKLNIED